MFIGAVLILLAAVWYFYLRRTPNPDDVAAAEAVATENLPGRELFPILYEVNAIDLEKNVQIFQSKIYNALIDFSRPLLPEPVKRQNPFAPFEGYREAPSSKQK